MSKASTNGWSPPAELLLRNPSTYGRFFDHLRTVGIRGFIAEHTHDEGLTHPPEARVEFQEMKSDTGSPTDQPASDDSGHNQAAAEDTE